MVETSLNTQEQQKIDLGKRIIILIGPEGAGKSEVGKLLAKYSNKPFISIGDTFRYLAASDKSEHGDACRAMFEKNAYMAPNILFDIMTHRFNQDDTRNGFVLDGGLRTLEETKTYPQVFKDSEREMPVSVVHLRLPGWKSMERLVTGPNARRRDRETIEGVLQRLTNYHTDLGKRATLIKEFDNWKLFHVDASPPLNIVFENTCKLLENSSYVIK